MYKVPFGRYRNKYILPFFIGLLIAIVIFNLDNLGAMFLLVLIFIVFPYFGLYYNLVEIEIDDENLRITYFYRLFDKTTTIQLLQIQKVEFHRTHTRGPGSIRFYLSERMYHSITHYFSMNELSYLEKAFILNNIEVINVG